MNQQQEPEAWEREIDDILSDCRCDCLEGWCKHVGRIKEVVRQAIRSASKE